MKKTIILSFALLFMAIFNYSLATDGGKTVPNRKISRCYESGSKCPRNHCTRKQTAARYWK
jgi:hypothetical protein